MNRVVIPMILPRPRSLQQNGQILPLKALKITGCGTDFAVAYLSQFAPVAVSPAEHGANIRLNRTEGFTENGYRLSVGTAAEIAFSEKEGLRNALASLIQLITPLGDGYGIAAAEITDFSPCTYRSVMIDLARGLPDIGRLKEDLKRLSLTKCNHIHFHLMDSLGIAYQSDVYRGSGDIRGTKPYTKQTIIEIVQFCHLLGMTVVPEIEFPAHASTLLATHPELKCDTDVDEPSTWVVCAGQEETYRFYDRLVEEVASLFPDEYIHIGGDELYFTDLPERNYRCHWESCRVCTALMAKEGLRDRWDLYNHAITRLSGIVKRHGRKMMMWNDQIDLNRPLAVPQDILMEFWRIADKNRGPAKGCTYERLTESFRVINADFSRNYVDCEGYAGPENTGSYKYLTYPAAARTENVLGGEACAWEYGNPAFDHYTLSFACSTALLLDKYWNADDAVYTKAYCRALTRLVLGCDTPPLYDMTELFGGPVPPRINGQTTYLDSSTKPEETLYPQHKVQLSSIRHTYSPLYLRALMHSIEKPPQQGL